MRISDGRPAPQRSRKPRPRRFRGPVLGVLLLVTAVLIVISPPQRGLVGAYYLNARWAGSPNMTTRESRIGLDRFRREYPRRTAGSSILWTGGIYIDVPGTYGFSTVADGDSEVRIDGRSVVDGSGEGEAEGRAGAVELSRGFHEILVRVSRTTGEGRFEAYWTPPGKPRRPLSSAPLFTRASKSPSALAAYRLRRILLPALLVLWGFLLARFLLTPGSAEPRAGGPKPGRTTLKLAAFLLLNGLILNLLLSLFSERTVLDYTRFYIRTPVHDGQDSWKQIANALDYLAAPHDRPLYAEVFFAQRNKFQYPPTSLLLLEPLRRLPYPRLVAAANMLSWAAIAASVVFLYLIFTRALTRYGGESRPSLEERGLRLALALGFTVTFYPLVKSYELGQIQTWLYFFFVLAVWAWTSGRKTLAGILIGAICVIKPQLGLLVVWGALRREWRFVAGAAATAGTLGLVSLGLFGWANHADYLKALSHMAKHGESYYTNQSVNGLLNRMFFNGTNLHGNPHAFAPFNRWIYLATMATSIALIASALFRKRGASRRTGDADFLMAALTFTIASPIAWEHHFSILLPIFAVALPVVLARRRGGWGPWALAAAFALTSNIYVAVNALANTRLNFLQSHLFFGSLALLVMLCLNRRAPDGEA